MAEQLQYDSEFPPEDENGPSPPPPDFSTLLASKPEDDGHDSEFPPEDENGPSPPPSSFAGLIASSCPALPKPEDAPYDADVSSDASSPPEPEPENLHYLVFEDSPPERKNTRASSPPSPTRSAKSSSSYDPEDFRYIDFEDFPSPTGSFDFQYQPKPADPRPWTWRCHMCGATYPLGVTRRCLTDGHYYCPRQRHINTTKPKRRGKPCTSRFDYQGWEEMNFWRKHTYDMRFLWGQEKDIPPDLTGHSCWNDCDFPSACRYFEHIRDKHSPPSCGLSYKDIYLRQISSPEKRKRLCDVADGVSYLPPAKVPKLRRDSERPSPPIKVEKTEEEPQRQTPNPPDVPVVPSSAPDTPILPKVSSDPPEKKESVKEEPSEPEQEDSSTKNPEIKQEQLSDEEWPEPGA